MRKKRWPWVAAVAGIVVAIAVAVMVSWLLLKPEALGDERARIAAVQAVAAIGFGVGGIGTLMLFVRRQWLQEQAHELDRERVALDRQVAERQHERESAKAADDRHDATERRITELYLTAAEQLGHDKAPVRLAALHALDRLGQNDADHRQVIVDIWCSYLRQPFTPPARFTAARNTADTPESGGHEGPVEVAPDDDIDSTDVEYEVRATAQRLLATHLNDPRKEADRGEEPPPVERRGFWSLSHIDLTGASLVNADFTGCWLPEATFTHARFSGYARFNRTLFSGDARFTSARFGAKAGFNGARFGGYAWFTDARFSRDAGFFRTQVGGKAWFGEARFSGYARFSEARFGGDAGFNGARFVGKAEFNGARFSGYAGFTRIWFGAKAGFNRTQFGGDAGFDGAQFNGYAGFNEARFDRKAGFNGARFGRDAEFNQARFGGDAGFGDARFVGYAGFCDAVAAFSREQRSHVWPQGWALEPITPRGQEEPDQARVVREKETDGRM